MNPVRRVKKVSVQAQLEMIRIAEMIFFVLAIPLSGVALYQLLKLMMRGGW